MLDPSPKVLLGLAAGCSSFAVCSLFIFFPLLSHDLAQMQMEMDLEMLEHKILTDDLWTDLMDIRKSSAVLTNRIRRQKDFVKKSESAENKRSESDGGDFENLAALSQGYEAESSYNDYKPKPKCDCEQRYNKCPPGYPGQPGQPGEDGYNGYPGSPGSPGIRVQPKEYEQHGPVVCPPCPAGPKGKPGYKGKNGYAGPAGPPGKPGYPPKYGKPGKPGYPGDTGHPGKPGNPGLAGHPGKPGVKGGKGYPGVKGKKGYPGSHGGQGKPGRQAKDGYPGKIGPPGPLGSSGYGAVDGKG